MPDQTLGQLLTGLVPGLLLLVAGAGHLAAPRVLISDLRRQALLGEPLIRPTAVTLPVAEIGAGVAAVLAVAGRLPTSAATLSHLVVVALYVAFAGYALALLRRAGEERVPCGCSPTGADVTGLVPLRAGVLAALALIAAVTAPSLAGVTGPELTVTWLAAATFVVLLWTAPSALETYRPPATVEEDAHVVRR